MKKINIVKENKDFSSIINKSPFVKDSNLVIYYRNNNLAYARFGISVGTKVGKAHTRNKLKRILRNIIDSEKKSYSKSKDYIIIVRKNCLAVDFKTIETSYKTLLKKIDIKEAAN